MCDWFNSGKSKSELRNSIGTVASPEHSPSWSNPVSLDRFDTKVLRRVDEKFQGHERNAALYELARIDFAKMASDLEKAADAISVKPSRWEFAGLMVKLEPQLKGLGIELPETSQGAWAMQMRLRQLSGLARQGAIESAQIKLEHMPSEVGGSQT